MRFVALVSGGKDSCYNILHCLKQGHQLVALGNLYPIDNVQELDSFMFQTVGFDIVSLYEKCCGVPLFRQSIKAKSSKNVSLNYSKTKFDEIEELYQLLKTVKEEIPGLEAVSVGAILSSYQRTRVEDVCDRLGLTVLSYLWQRDQLQLMTEMCEMSRQPGQQLGDGKFDARLIKVAAIGLDDSHLGKSLPEILPTMRKLNKMYDVHVCGEGGEFESMVLDAPFFKNGYLKLKEVHIIPPNSNDGVFNCTLNVEFQERFLDQAFLQDELHRMAVPKYLNNQWCELLDFVDNIDSPLTQEKDYNSLSLKIPLNIYEIDNLLYISNIRSDPLVYSTIDEQVHDIFYQLGGILKERDLVPSQVINSSLILSNINDFSKVNSIYNDFFDISKWGPLPPTRSCVGSTLLGSGNQIQLSVIVDTFGTVVKNTEYNISINSNKNGLHVQGRSYWAPCNIGPYSQAIFLNNDPNRITFISGQIPLIPESMQLCEDDLRLQAILSLKHFDTLKCTLPAKEQLSMTCYVTRSEIIPVISKTWHIYTSEIMYQSDLWLEKDNEPSQNLIIVKLTQLPRNALCEWGGIACRSLDTRDECNEKSKATVLPDSIEKKVLSDDKTQSFSTFFTDSLQELRGILTVPGHYTVYFNPEECFDFSNLANATAEFYPVECVFDSKGNPRIFGIHKRA